jgi:hypothetical protein
MALFGPFGKAAKLGGLSAMLGGYGVDADAAPIAKLLRMGSPEVKKWLDQVLNRVRPEDAERAENIVRDMPYTAEVYSPDAVSEALSSQAQLRGVMPDNFLELAYPIGALDNVTKGSVAHYTDLLERGQWSEPSKGVFTPEYLDRQRKVPFEGFDEVPFLGIEEGDMSWAVKDHEGRHRNMALWNLYGGDIPQLTRFLRHAEYDKPLTRKFPHIVTPEVGGSPYAIDLSKTRRYALGGLAQFRGY